MVFVVLGNVLNAPFVRTKILVSNLYQLFKYFDSNSTSFEIISNSRNVHL